MTVYVLDYGLGNLKSLTWGLQRIGVKCEVTDDANMIRLAEALIIPGVGSFGQAISNIKNLGLFSLLQSLAREKSCRILGICLGMQILFEGSEESPEATGLGILPGRFEKLNSNKCRVPHIGWNDLIEVNGVDFNYLVDVPKDSDFYFVHSYALLQTEVEAARQTKVGSEVFYSYLESGNITCAQFHPEKSHANGLRFLKNWVEG